MGVAQESSASPKSDFGLDDPELHLAEVFGEIARSLLSEDHVDATLAKILELAVKELEGCESAGID